MVPVKSSSSLQQNQDTKQDFVGKTFGDIPTKRIGWKGFSVSRMDVEANRKTTCSGYIAKTANH
jgi:hypothetical protein